MSSSTIPDDESVVYKTLEELDAEFDRDEDGNIIDRPILPTGVSYEPVPGNSAGLAPKPGAKLAVSRDRPAASDSRPFAAEIEALRLDLQRLQLAFECTTSIEDHHQLAVTMSLITASLARMVRAQDTLIQNRPVEFNREIRVALAIVMKEWVRTT
jgi:hypothetical protein